MNLRPYQIEAQNQILESFKRGNKRVILCIPTGGGKTVVFADMVKKAINKGKRTMIICDRRELISQAESKLKENGILPTIIAPGYEQRINNCYLASVDTLIRRTLPDVDLIVIDEAHKTTFDKIIDKYMTEVSGKPEPYIIGATATPKRSPKKPLDKYYQDIIEPITISSLIDSHFLVPAITFGAKQDLSDIKKKGDDYDEKHLFDYFNKAKMYEGVVDNYVKFASGKKALVFNINVEHSLKTCDEFNRRGIPAAHIDGNTPKGTRDNIFKAFIAGRFLVLCNCGIATTGTDIPTVEAVIANFSTMSLIKWLQVGGRGGRICDEIGKENFIFIDMGSNVYTHGFWEQEREWSLSAGPASKNIGVAPIKSCEACESLIPAQATVCKFCSAQQTMKEKEAAQLLKAEFVQLEAPAKIFIPVHLRKAWRNMNDEELEEYRVLKGYKKGWVAKQKELRDGPSMLTKGQQNNQAA